MFSSSKTGNQPASGSSNDPQFNYVTLLLNGDGTNGGQNNTFIDSSSNSYTITRNGTPTQGSFSPYGDLWSNYFNGTGYLINSSSSSNLGMGTGDFTFEVWLYYIGNAGGYNFAPCFTLRTNQNQTLSSGDTDGVYLNAMAASIDIKISGTTTNIGAGTSLPTNQWVHLAVTRQAGTVKLFVNGVQSGSSVTVSGNMVANYIQIGCDGFSTIKGLLVGYMSNLRIVKGTALYTASFTPPTTPLTAITNTVLLTCQSNRFKDNSTNNFTITANGTPSVQRFSPFEPSSSYSTSVIGGSGYFSGTTQYLTAANNTAFDFGSGDFTIEAWVYITSSTPSDQTFWSKRASNAVYAPINVGIKKVGSVYRSFFLGSLNGTTWGINGSFVAGSIDIPLNTWTHLAVVRNGTTFTSYVNGISDLSLTGISGALMTNTTAQAIGAGGTDGNTAWYGYLSSVRAVKGTAVYTGAFTPSTSPLTAITGTSLLVTFDNAAIPDLSAKNDLITVGNTQISTTQKKHGTGSLSFDGSGDYLSIADNVNQQLLNGDFTIEGWVYLNSNGVAYGLISKGTSTTGWSVNITSGNKLQFSYTSSNLTGTTSLSATTWYHFAVVRNGSSTGNLKIYLNGVLEATSAGAVTDNFNQTSTLYVGADRVASSQLNGYLDDVRVSRGIVRYTAAFTPPTAALPTY